MSTYNIPVVNVTALVATLDSLIRRAKKHGFSAISYDIAENIVQDDSVYTPVTIHGALPVFNGYTLVGVLEHTTDGNIVRIVPEYAGTFNTVQYRTCVAYCEHCHTSRVRNNTYLVRKGQQIVQVGSSCLKDFLGSDSVDDLMSIYLDVVDACTSAQKNEDDFYDKTSSCIPLLRYLSYVSLVMRQGGFVSRATARETPDKVSTANTAYNLMTDRLNTEFPSDSDDTRAKNALQWIRELTTDNWSDYLYNLSIVCKHNAIDYRHIGIAGSLIAAYEKAQAIEIEKKTVKASSQYQGTVGKRSAFSGLTCTFVKECASYYGVTYLHKFTDGSGNVYTWFSSSEKLEQGKVYSVTGSVKAHEEYQGMKQTVLTRCKCQEV